MTEKRIRIIKKWASGTYDKCKSRKLFSGGIKQVNYYLTKKEGDEPKLNKMCYWAINWTLNLWIHVCEAKCGYCTHDGDTVPLTSEETLSNTITAMQILFDGFLNKVIIPGQLIYLGSKSDHLSPILTDSQVMAIMDFVRKYPQLNFVLFTKYPGRLIEIYNRYSTFEIPSNLAVMATVESDLENYVNSISPDYVDTPAVCNCKPPSPLSRIKAIVILKEMNVVAGFSVSPAIRSSKCFPQMLIDAKPDLIIVGGVNKVCNSIKDFEAAWLLDNNELAYTSPRIVGRRAIRFPWLTALMGRGFIHVLEEKVKNTNTVLYCTVSTSLCRAGI